MADYGSPVSAATDAIFKSLQDRQAIARQQMLDQIDIEQKKAQIANSTANTKSLELQREHESEIHAENVFTAKQAAWIKTHVQGMPLTPDDVAEAMKLKLGHLIIPAQPGGMATFGDGGAPIALPVQTPTTPSVLPLGSTGPQQPEQPSDMLAPGAPVADTLAGAGGVPGAIVARAPDKPATFAGSPADLEHDQQVQGLRALAAKQKNPQLQQVYATLADLAEAGVTKGIDPTKLIEAATGMIAPKPASLTDLQAQAIQTNAKAYEAKGMTPETALAKAVNDYHEANTHISVNAATERSSESDLHSTYKTEVADVRRAKAPVIQSLDRATKLIDTLNTEAGPADAVAIAEFLSVMAGGFGTGLRMNEAELNQIRMSGDIWKRIRTEATKLGLLTDWGGKPVPEGLVQQISPEMRTQMVKLAEAARTRLSARANHYDETIAKLSDATSGTEIRKIAGQFGTMETKLAAGDPEAYAAVLKLKTNAAPAAPKYKATVE